MEAALNDPLLLKDLLHVVSQDFLVPTMFILALLIIYSVFCLGALAAELFTERRHFKHNVPAFVNAVSDASCNDVLGIIEKSKLLKSQKEVLETVARNMGLSEEDLFAVAKAEVARGNARRKRTVARTDFAAKVAPMFGLMGTLIPLGPGIVAMGSGQVEVLSSSLLIAFDTTVAGLVAAVVCLLVTRVRRSWYAEYLSAMEASMTAVLEKAADARAEGVKLPSGYAPELKARTWWGRLKAFMKKRGAGKAGGTTDGTIGGAVAASTAGSAGRASGDATTASTGSAGGATGDVVAGAVDDAACGVDMDTPASKEA